MAGFRSADNFYRRRVKLLRSWWWFALWCAMRGLSNRRGRPQPQPLNCLCNKHRRSEKQNFRKNPLAPSHPLSQAQLLLFVFLVFACSAGESFWTRPVSWSLSPGLSPRVSDGPVLDQLLHNVAHFWASLPAHLCSRLSRRVDRRI